MNCARTSKLRSAGFSMIDVLVAIVVLATALLALAALQGALTRNNADSRARSQVAAYSEGLLDQLRSGGWDSIATTSITPSNATGATSQQKQAYNVQATTGVSGLSTTITSTAYYGSTDGLGTSFSTTAPADLTTQTPRYKEVKVATTWTDATGQPRSLTLDTMVSPLQTSSDNSLDAQSLSISGSATPVVREYNPGATAGVIPIAIGTSQQSAATNPKPELLALNGNNSAVVGTSFNILTYENPDGDNLAKIQQRVDTQVIRCYCKIGGPVTSDDNTDFASVITQPYRPTYWDGTRYVEPSATSSTTSATGIDTTATQSPYCDICCRDHNDVDADEIKFDPWDTSNTRYKKYRHDNTGALVEVTNNSYAYENACRIIRVEGSYAVATDLNDYFFGLLATTSPSTTAASSPIPDTIDTTDFGTGGAVAKYQTFVKKYLDDNVNVATNLQNHVIPNISTEKTNYASANLDIPTNIDITYNSSTPDYRYLHARGIYVDYLEPDAVTAINNAITNCTSGTVSDCYLPILPFTTINLTELANWTSAANTSACTGPVAAVTVNNTAIISEAFNTQRGVVTGRSCANANETANVTASINDSNSGIAATGTGFAAPVDMNDAGVSQSDAQQFTKTGGTAGAHTVTPTIYLTPVPANKNEVLPMLIKGYQSTYPSISWNLDATTAPTASLTACAATATGNGGNTQLQYYTCPSITTQTSTPVSNAVVTVKLQTYNYAYTVSVNNPCPSGNGKVNEQHCVNYAIDQAAVLLNGTAITPTSVTVTNDGNVGNSTKGTTAELSSIVLPASTLNATDTISIGFSQTADNTQSYTCSGKVPTYDTCN